MPAMDTEGNFRPCINAVENVENATDRSPLLPRNQISGRRNFRPIPNLHTENNVEGSENRLEGKKKTSDAGTLLHLVKGNVGTGILAMAMALSNFGLVAGAIGICVLGSCCTYCMKLLVYCSQMAVDEQTGRNQSPEPQTESVPSSANAAVGVDRLVVFFRNRNSTDIHETGYQRADQGMQINYQDSENQAFEENSSLDYAGTAYAAFLHGPKCLQRLAFPMRYIVNALLILTQFGFCCVYLLFVGQSLREVFLNTKFLTSLNTTAIMALELLVMIPLNFIPDLDTLTVVSTTAVCLQSVGLLMMFVDFCSGPLSDSYILYLAPAWKWPLFFGTAMFSFEGIGVILPLEMEMKNKRNFPRILYGGMTIVTCMYLLIGIGGYLKYGADVKPSITFNLPAGCTSELIRSLFALAIFLSYPLQMYVPLSFVMPYLKGIFLPERRNRWVERAADWLIRATFVLITFGVAVSVPMLDLIIALIGSFASSGLALILPPVIHIVTILKYDDIKWKYAQIGFDAFLSILGFSGLAVGAYTSVSEIMNRNATEIALDIASYDELMSSGTDEAILLLSSKNSSCCSLFH